MKVGWWEAVGEVEGGVVGEMGKRVVGETRRGVVGWEGGQSKNRYRG